MSSETQITPEEADKRFADGLRRLQDEHLARLKLLICETSKAEEDREAAD